MNLIKQISLIAVILLLSSVVMLAQSDKVNWYSLEDAIQATQDNPKKIFVDVYTDWCGWCKRMDKAAFTDPKVIEYLNSNFYPVKFNAEQKTPITYKGKTYEFVKSGRRGYNQLAAKLLNGRLAYPTTLVLDENAESIIISPGFKDNHGIMRELKFAHEEIYKTQSFEEYKARG